MEILKQQWMNDDRLNVHFLPTLGCNFRCPYCYQDGVGRNYNMTNNDVNEVIERLDEYLKDNPQIKRLLVTLHGGEPTCNWNVVPYALSSLEKLSQKYCLKLSTTIVSNGYLLDSDKANLLHKYNWRRFQVTLDGVGDVNNKRRRLINGGDTFTTITNNIKYVLENDLIEVVDIRMNFDNENWSSIPELLDYLSKNFPKDRLYLSFGLVTQTVEGTGANTHIDQVGITNQDFIEKYIYLYKYALNKGFHMGDSYVYSSICVGKMRNAFTFSPDRNIYKCLSTVGRSDRAEGTWDKYGALNQVNGLMNFGLYDECFSKKCPLIPICNCDCRFEALLYKGDAKKIYCKKDMLMELNEKILYTKYINRN